ncbi:hypothetical protein NA78x_005301 [Anatilimnocola sp. NA78]|uniref:hypothetical protein n=1 Tax=Anatilimnocola sp. NA78 TaxID=3415683 RepID=UPI003CE4AFEB
MFISCTKRICCYLIALSLACWAAASLPVEALAQTPSKAPNKSATAKKLTPQELKATVHAKLGRNPYYAPGFLLSRGDVDDVCEELEDKGFEMPSDREALYEDLLGDSSPLVKLLKTPQGRTFMKKVAGDPTVYDRMERLSWSFDGRVWLEKIVSAKDGPAKLKQLQTKEQVAKLSKALASDPRTQDFALPTGRVHTADELCEHLTQLLEQKDAE